MQKNAYHLRDLIENLKDSWLLMVRIQCRQSNSSLHPPSQRVDYYLLSSDNNRILVKYVK